MGTATLPRYLEVQLQLGQAVLLIHEDGQHLLKRQILAQAPSCHMLPTWRPTCLTIDEAGQTCKGLFARATHTHQKRAAAGILRDAANTLAVASLTQAPAFHTSREIRQCFWQGLTLRCTIQQFCQGHANMHCNGKI